LHHNANRFAACLLCAILIARPVRQALALDTTQGLRRPFSIGDTKVGAVVMAEFKFNAMAFQVLLAAERGCAAHAALEDGVRQEQGPTSRENLRQKAHLNREILEASRGMMISMLR
jgi:hypothetical protein